MLCWRCRGCCGGARCFYGVHQACVWGLRARETGGGKRMDWMEDDGQRWVLRDEEEAMGAGWRGDGRREMEMKMGCCVRGVAMGGLRFAPDRDEMEMVGGLLREMKRSDPRASASVESDDGDGVMGFNGDGFAACVEEDDERE
ncbi:hypothetical protein AAC387_Pa03g1459 [Persea americana]